MVRAHGLPLTYAASVLNSIEGARLGQGCRICGSAFSAKDESASSVRHRLRRDHDAELLSSMVEERAVSLSKVTRTQTRAASCRRLRHCAEANSRNPRCLRCVCSSTDAIGPAVPIGALAAGVRPHLLFRNRKAGLAEMLGLSSAHVSPSPDVQAAL